MDYLYEDLQSDIKHILDLKKRRLHISNVDKNRSDSDPETITTNSNYNDTKKHIDEVFVKRLIDYLESSVDSSFPSQGTLKNAIASELRKVVKTGNDKELKKLVEKIRDIVFKEKTRFMDNIEKRVSKLLIDKY